MQADQIIRDVQESLAEWIEMSEDPAAFVAGVLATKIIKLQDHIDYLEKRIKNDSMHNGKQKIYSRDA